MINWILGKIRWVLIIAAIGGPVVSFLGFSELSSIAKLESDGTTTAAVITEAYRKEGRRSGTSYGVSLAWEDASGQPRTASDVVIDSSFAKDIIQNDILMVDVVDIRYLESEPEADPMVVASIPGETETAEFMKLGGIAGAIIGIIGSILMFMVGRKKKPVSQA